MTDSIDVLLLALNRDKDRAIAESTAITNTIRQQTEANATRKRAYEGYRAVLLDPYSTTEELFCTTRALLDDRTPGADPDLVQATQKRVENLRTLVRSFSVRADVLLKDFPNCVNEALLEGIKVAGEGLLARADRYDTALKGVSADLKKLEDFREIAEATIRNPNSFQQTRQIGPFAETKTVSVGLKSTKLAPAEGEVAETEIVKASETVLKFGHAPFFSISGGMVFSPLRKREFVRVQGFELDAQGAPVLVEGKPNFTTIVGLKEDSPTRITPLVMLNGRFSSRRVGPIEGWHLSLGVTAKNDNQGTDVEFLVGPSVSMLENKLFLTFGGYAGRQQKLAGNLFEGARVPEEVDELPIQKNYRWNAGFSLTYRLPIGDN